MIDAQDTLLSLAEVAIALAGFSAIVVVLKRGALGKWSLADADKFHGMVIHSVFAVVFCLLPSLLNVVIQDVVTTIHVGCALLGIELLAHSIGVMCFSTTDWRGKIALSLGFLVGLLQFTAFSDWGVQREFELYTVGIMWHILQAGLLFVMLVWIPATSIESDADDL